MPRRQQQPSAARTSTGARRSPLVCKAGLLAPEPPGKTPWYAKNKELWLELATHDEHQRALASLPPGKLLVIDFYASWCSVCKAAYPGLCRMAGADEYKQHFVFAKANIENSDIKALIKAEGIVGIPWMSVYRASGKVIGFGASFKKLEIIRSNLLVIAANKDAEFQPDPNGFLVVKGAVNATAP